MDMRVFTSALFLLLCAVPVFAGGPISREEAERLFFENNVELKLKQTELRRADADVTGARAVPNPVAGYGVESFPSGGREKEETFSLSQELDLFGKRGKRIETASRRKAAVVLQADYKTSLLLALVPFAFAADKPGNEILSPLAVVILGGLLSSTALNMVVLPSLYIKYGKEKEI